MPDTAPLTRTEIRRLRSRLLAWYDATHRDLPWRRGPWARDPYAIWVSEVMLQQTQVAVVVPFYERFLARFPKIQHLAAAGEADVLALWSGLGYYRRARQLRAAAIEVCRRWDGNLPSSRAALMELPGIGRYTAGAVLSLAHGLVVPAVDGNVVRVYRRLRRSPSAPLGLIENSIVPWIDDLRPGDFNQGLMELGARICTPRAPQCRACPLHAGCRTRGEGSQLAGKKPVLRRLNPRYALWQRPTRTGTAVALVQRSATATVMPGLWELPTHHGTGEVLGVVTHAITTSRIRAEIVAPSSDTPRPLAVWMHREKALAAPLTGLARKVLRRFLAW